MIIVTGGFGMIGSNLIAYLNKHNYDDILVVDDLSNGRKSLNLNNSRISDYLDKADFLQLLENKTLFADCTTMFHLGACSSTTEWDGKYMMKNNYEYSKTLLNWCQDSHVQFIYASSASVYGLGHNGFIENDQCEQPINMYAFSKYLFDRYVRLHAHEFSSQVVGLRYFNVYGPNEAHKTSMASTPYHFNNQILETGTVNVFEGCDGYANGEQRRDFVYVEDCAKVNKWFMDNNDKSGIFNVGTGQSETFNTVASLIVDWHASRGNKGQINYIQFPAHLKGAYQSFTQANISKLKELGYTDNFYTIQEGINEYMCWLNKDNI